MIGKAFKNVVLYILILMGAVLFALALECAKDCNLFGLELILTQVHGFVSGVLDCIPLGDVAFNAVFALVRPQANAGYSVAALINELLNALFLGCCITILKQLFRKSKFKKFIGSIGGIAGGTLILMTLKGAGDTMKTVMMIAFVVLAFVALWFIIKSQYKRKFPAPFFISRILSVALNSIWAIIAYNFFAMVSSLMIFEFVKNADNITKIIVVVIFTVTALLITEIANDAIDGTKDNKWSLF